MIALMYGARSRVVLTAPYVIPSEAFLSAMCSTARRGVAVDLIVDQESNKPLVQLAQQSYYDAMLEAGVRIHRHTGSFLHAKHLSVDDEVALIGSSNLDIRSFALNAEVSVLIYDRAVVADLKRGAGRLSAHTRRWSRAKNARAAARRPPRAGESRAADRLAALMSDPPRPTPPWSCSPAARIPRRASRGRSTAMRTSRPSASTTGSGTRSNWPAARLSSPRCASAIRKWSRRLGDGSRARPRPDQDARRYGADRATAKSRWAPTACRRHSCRAATSCS